MPRLIPPKTTKTAELEYYQKLLPIVTYIDKKFNSVVMPVVSRKSVQEEIVDASALSLINKAFDDFAAQVNGKITQKKITELATEVVKKSVKRNQYFWKSKMKDFGISIRGKESFKGESDYVKSRISTNVTLIKNLKSQYVEELSIDLANSYEQGRPSSQLAKDIEKRFGITKRRAKLIARNEIKNTNSQLNKKQALELGFDKATWLTAMDGRERPQHAKHNKKTYEIGVGLSDGKGGKEEPGDAINCRCTFYVDVK